VAEKVYYDNSDEGQRFQSATIAEAEAVDEKFDQVATGLSEAEQDTRRALKFPFEPGMASQEFLVTALQRRNKVLGFDDKGNVAVKGGFAWRGDWATGTDYLVNDVFRDSVSKNLYLVQIFHTSTVLANNIASGLVSLSIDVSEVEAAKALAQNAASAASQSSDESDASASASETSANASEVSRINSESSAVASSGFADDSAASAVSAAASYDDFDDRYLGPKASAPATDNDGDPLTDGVLYFDTTDKRMKVYDSTLGQFKNAGSTVDALYQRQNYVATEGQTTFAAQYDAPFVQVLTNGLLLPPGDYDASSGTEVVLNAGVSAGTEVTLIGLGAFQVADTWSKAEADTRYAEVTGGADANFTTMPQVGGDPIVESGSNADGEWTRWSDGTQACHARQVKTSSAVTTSLGSMYRSSTQTWTFPVAFSADTYGVSGVSSRGDGYSGGSILADPSWADELTQFKYVLLSTVSSASAIRNVSTHAIGRWQ